MIQEVGSSFLADPSSIPREITYQGVHNVPGSGLIEAGVLLTIECENTTKINLTAKARNPGGVQYLAVKTYGVSGTNPLPSPWNYHSIVQGGFDSQGNVPVLLSAMGYYPPLPPGAPLPQIVPIEVLVQNTGGSAEARPYHTVYVEVEALSFNGNRTWFVVKYFPRT